jgi:restriction system protein
MASPASRRAGRPTQSEPLPAFLVFGALGAGSVVLAVSWLAAHPLLAVVLGLVIGAGAGLVVEEWWKRRERQRARACRQVRVEAARAAEIASYHQMTSRQFEHAVAYLCQRDGCTDVQVVGGAGDLGADVKALAPDGRRIVVQCKRYAGTRKVGSPDMQRFGGTCYTVHGAHVAVLVTTSTFTRQAVEYGTRHGIRCYDNEALSGWASRTGPAPWFT